MQTRFMRRAIELAEEAVKAGGAPYGALIADPATGAIVAEGANHAAHNPIWHGEMAAIANLSALSNISVYARAGALELYTTAEPCPMCMSAIEWSGFAAVLFGTSIPFIEACGAAQISVRASEVAARTSFHNISLHGGVLANETNRLYRGGHGLETPLARREHQHGSHDDAARELKAVLQRVLFGTGMANDGSVLASSDLSQSPTSSPTSTNILVGYHSVTNRTAALAALVRDGAAQWAGTQARLKQVGSIGCDDLRWMHGLALGSPVYWGTMAGSVKYFIDEVQTRCFGWPVKELRWRAGAAFATGAHVSAGKDSAISTIHGSMLSVQMVVVGSDSPYADCLTGACATNRNESASVPELTPNEADGAKGLGRRLAQTAARLRPLMS